jgi:hypothetical protein
MAKNVFLGTAPAVAQVTNVTPGTVEAGDIFRITLSDDAGHSYQIAFTSAGTTVAGVTAGLLAAANVAKAAGLSPWTLVTAADIGTALTITAMTAGVPFTATCSTVNGGANNTQTLVATVGTASSGPSDAGIAANWSLGAIPVATNEMYLENCAVDLLYGLDFSAVGLNSFNVAQTFTGKIGQAAVAGAGYLKINTPLADIGYHFAGGTPSGSGRVKLDFGSATAAAITVHNSASSPAETNRPVVRLLAANAATVLNVRKGKVGIACESPTETSTLSAINESYVASVASDAELTIGAGVTLTTLTKTGGKATLLCAATNVINRAGDLLTSGTGAITTLTVEGGTVTSNATGTITTLNADGGQIDFTKSTSARTLTTLAARKGSTAVVSYDPAVLTVTNKLAPAGAVAISLAAA